MIMNRTLLRMAAVCAMNNFDAEPYPTMAKEHIYDSKIEPIEDFAKTGLFPMVAVYTDYDRDFWLHQGANNKEGRRLTLTVELVVSQVSGLGTNYKVDLPIVDSEVETSLDVLEAQIFRALTAQHVAANYVRHLTQCWVDVVSRRGASADSGQRLAARQITIEAAVDRDTLSGQISDPCQAFLDALASNASYMDRLPPIQQLLVNNASMTTDDQIMTNLSVSDQTAAALGLERGQQPLLGTPVVWLNSNGQSPLN